MIVVLLSKTFLIFFTFLLSFLVKTNLFAFTKGKMDKVRKLVVVGVVFVVICETVAGRCSCKDVCCSIDGYFPRLEWLRNPQSPKQRDCLKLSDGSRKMKVKSKMSKNHTQMPIFFFFKSSP